MDIFVLENLIDMKKKFVTLILSIVCFTSFGQSKYWNEDYIREDKNLIEYVKRALNVNNTSIIPVWLDEEEGEVTSLYYRAQVWCYNVVQIKISTAVDAAPSRAYYKLEEVLKKHFGSYCKIFINKNGYVTITPE